MHTMSVGTSVLVVAVGAILRYAITADVSGVDLDVLGLILMVAGVAGLALSLLYTAVQGSGEQRPPTTRR